MATVTGYTATRMQAIEDNTIVDGEIDASGHLILTKNDATTVDAGPVISAGGTPFVGQYTTAGRPAATGLTGKILWDTDLLSFYKSNGTTWTALSLGSILSLVEGSGILIDDTDPANPIINFSAPTYTNAGVTGAVQGGKWVGVTADVAPTTGGPFALGDWVISRTGRLWTCTGAGSPGTWVETTEALDQLDDGTGSTLNTVTPGFIKVDIDLSTGVTGGQSVIGGIGAGDDLILVSTTHATKGTVAILDTDPTYAAAPEALFGILSARTITSNYAAQLQPTFLKDASTRINGTSGVSGANPLVGLHFAGVYKNASTVAAHLTSATTGLASGWQGVWDQQTSRADGATINAGTVRSFRAGHQFDVINAGVISNGYYRGFQSAGLSVGAGVTLTDISHFHVAQPTAITGTVPTQYGIYLPALTGATLNVGIMNHGTARLVGATTFGADAAATANTMIDIQAGTIGLRNAQPSRLVGNVAIGVDAAASVEMDIDGFMAVRRSTLAPSSGLNSDVALPLTGFVVVTSPGAAFSIDGFAAGANGQSFWLVFPNDGATNVLTIVNEATSASAVGNRIKTPDGANRVTAAAGTGVFQFIYDATAGFWYLLAHAL